MRLTLTSLAYLLCLSLTAQQTADFENFDLAVDTFLNDAGAAGAFASGPVRLPNDYNSDFDAWQGWAISTMTDSLTPGFGNQYSAIAGSGTEGSATYALTYAFDGSVLRFDPAAGPRTVEGLYVTNSTYAYYAMLEGDAFSKRFGGETGDDPDFFLLTVKKYLDGAPGADSVDFFLADYRFLDNKEDYLVSQWTFLDLSVLGRADSLLFTLRSSDVGAFGMNTPAYFCVDNIRTAAGTTSTGALAAAPAIRVFPNPTADFLFLEWEEARDTHLALYDLQGRRLLETRLTTGRNRIDLRRLPRGIYVLQLPGRAGWSSRRVVKQ